MRSLQLIQIRLGYYQLSRPLDLLLVLYIQLSHSHCFRRIDFVLSEKLSGLSSKTSSPRAISEA